MVIVLSHPSSCFFSVHVYWTMVTNDWTLLLGWHDFSVSLNVHFPLSEASSFTPRYRLSRDYGLFGPSKGRRSTWRTIWFFWGLSSFNHFDRGSPVESALHRAFHTHFLFVIAPVRWRLKTTLSRIRWILGYLFFLGQFRILINLTSATLLILVIPLLLIERVLFWIDQVALSLQREIWVCFEYFVEFSLSIVDLR